MGRALALLFTVADLQFASADELALDPSVEFATSVNDNFLFTANPSPTALVLALTPRLVMSENTESTHLKLDLSATSYRVLGEQAEDHTNLNLGLSYDLTEEKEKLKLNLGFVRDRTYEGELFTTGVLLAPLTRNDRSATANWTHSFSERLSGSAQMVTDIARYSAPIQGAEASNYHYYAVPVSASYKVTEQDSLTLAITDSLYHADDVHNRSNSEEIQFAWEHHFDERGVISIGAGEFQTTTHIRQNLTVCPINPEFCALGLVPLVSLESKTDARAAGPIFNASLSYDLTEKDAFSAHASRDLEPSGVGSLVLVESFDTSIKHTLSETTFANLTFSRARSQVLGAAGAFANGFEAIGASYAWRPTITSNIEIGARRLQTTHDQPGPSIKADEVYANFRYSWPDSAAAQAQ